MKHDKFNHRGIFKCAICERNTRDTGQGVDHLCAMCYEIAGIDNEINDNGYAADSTEYRDRLDECNTYLRKIQAKGGNVKRVVNQNEYVWQNGMADFN